MTLSKFLRNMPLSLAKKILIEVKKGASPSDIPAKCSAFCQNNCSALLQGKLSECYFIRELTDNQKSFIKKTTSIEVCVSYLKVTYDPLPEMIEVLGKYIK